MDSVEIDNEAPQFTAFGRTIVNHLHGFRAEQLRRRLMRWFRGQNLRNIGMHPINDSVLGPTVKQILSQHVQVTEC